MPPSRWSASLSGIATAAVVGVGTWWLAAAPLVAASAALFCGLAVLTGLWGVARLSWDGDEPTAGATEFLLVGAISTLPVLVIVPVIALDAALADRLALVALVLGVGFTGFGGCTTMLVVSHQRTGASLTFDVETHADAE